MQPAKVKYSVDFPHIHYGVTFSRVDLDNRSKGIRLMLRLFLLLWFLLSIVPAVRAQLEGNETPQLLLKRIEKTSPDTNRVKLELRLGGYYLFKPGAFKNDLDSAFHFFNKALQLSNSLHSIKLYNEGILLKGDCYLEGKNLDLGIFWFMKAINYYRMTGNVKKEADVWRRLGDCIPDENEFYMNKMISCYFHARSLYKSVNDTTDERQVLTEETDASIEKAHFLKARLDSLNNKEFELKNKANKHLFQQKAKRFTAPTIYAQLKGNETPQLLLKYIKKTSPDTNRVKLELRLGGYYLFKPGAFKNDLDSAVQFLNQALRLSDSLHSIKMYNEAALLIGDCFLESNNLESGTLWFMKVINNYHKAGNLKKEADVWHRLGDCITDKNAYFVSKRVSYYAYAKGLYKSVKDSKDESKALKDERQASKEEAYLLQVQADPLKYEADSLKNRANDHLFQKKVELAESELKRALALYKIAGYKNLHYTYDLLAAANALKGDLHQELFYRLETVKSMEATCDMELAPQFYYALARTGFLIGINDKDFILNKGALYCKKVHDYRTLTYFIGLYTRVLLRQSKQKEALVFLRENINSSGILHSVETTMLDWVRAYLYEASGRNDLAEKYYEKMIKLTENYGPEPDMQEARANDLMIIINFYIQTKQFAKAGHYVKIMNKLPRNDIHVASLANMATYQFEVDSAAGKYMAAIRDFELNKKLSDSLFNVTKSRQIAEMQIKYETAQKEKDLQLQQKNIQILKKQSQLEKEQVIKTRTTRNILIGGSCVLLLFLGVLYNRYRLKQRSNVLLQKQKVEISGKNMILEGLLQDNKWLMRELHHRVKNNMQMVMSLLSSQGAYLKDEVAIKTVTESQHRIQAMSLIHQKLYKTNNVSEIYMPEYVYELVDYLKESFKQEKLIYFDLHIDPFFLDVLQAVPIGLILNEAITNSIKYAFTYSKQGNITVRLEMLGNSEILLNVNDDGMGLPDDFDIHGSNTFGIILMNGLTRDLGGKLAIFSNPGTSVKIKFPVTSAIQKTVTES